MAHEPDFGLMVANVSNDVAEALIEKVTDARIRACNYNLREVAEDAMDHWQAGQRYIALFGAWDAMRIICLTQIARPLCQQNHQGLHKQKFF
jgi:hypothetical protein